MKNVVFNRIKNMFTSLFRTERYFIVFYTATEEKRFYGYAGFTAGGYKPFLIRHKVISELSRDMPRAQNIIITNIKELSRIEYKLFWKEE